MVYFISCFTMLQGFIRTAVTFVTAGGGQARKNYKQERPVKRSN